MAKGSQRAAPPDHRPTGGFVLRTPLLSRDELERWGEGLAVPAASDDAEALAAALEADRAALLADRRRLPVQADRRAARRPRGPPAPAVSPQLQPVQGRRPAALRDAAR